MSKSRPRIRIQIVALAFILFPAAAGVLAVHASATCERFVRTYITKPVRNRVSRQTAEAWAKWRLAHPNWKPNPNVHRPRYVMSREEAIQKVSFACSVDEIPTSTEKLLEITAIEPPQPIIDLSSMTPTDINVPAEIPPEVAEITPDNSWPSLGPYVPPILTGTPPGSLGVPIVPPVQEPGPVPEPSTLALCGLGLALFAGTLLRARRTAA